MRKSVLAGAVLAAALAGLLLAGSAALEAADIQWSDGDGGSGTINSATWNDLQTAITSAEGGGNAGWVKVSGDLTRAAGDTTVGDLEVTAGNLTISGGWDGTFTGQGAMSTLNANGSYSNTDAYRVLRIAASNVAVNSFLVTGGFVDRRMIDDTSDANFHSGAGILVDGLVGGSAIALDNITLQNLRVTGNRGNYKYNRGNGGGIAIDSGSSSAGFKLTNIRISGVEVDNNYVALTAGGILADGGTSSAPLIIENCNIHDNAADTRGSSAGGGIATAAGGTNWGQHYVLVANTRIEGNQAEYGGGIYAPTQTSGSAFLIFGCLIADNDLDSQNNAARQGSAIYAGGQRSLYMANTTVVNNTDPNYADKLGIYLRESNYAATTQNYFINDVVKDNNGIETLERSAKPNYNHVNSLRSTYDEGLVAQYDTTTTVLQSAATFAGALAFTGPLWHSLDDADGVFQTMQNDLDGDPSFLGAGADPYQLAAGSNSLNNGLTLSGSHADLSGNFLFVDMDANSVYDPTRDVIVDLQGSSLIGSSAIHFIYVTDLLGNPRVTGAAIDRGPYERVPEPATIALLGIGFAGIAALRRRKR